MHKSRNRNHDSNGVSHINIPEGPRVVIVCRLMQRQNLASVEFQNRFNRILPPNLIIINLKIRFSGLNISVIFLDWNGAGPFSEIPRLPGPLDQSMGVSRKSGVVWLYLSYVETRRLNLISNLCGFHRFIAETKSKLSQKIPASHIKHFPRIAQVE